jgi:hypothetical protein
MKLTEAQEIRKLMDGLGVQPRGLVNEVNVPMKIKLVVTNTNTDETYPVAVFARRGDALMCRDLLQKSTKASNMKYSLDHSGR